MKSGAKCCGCWTSFIQGFIQKNASKRRNIYRRNKYNEKEYNVEFENLVEEEDFYAPPQHIITDVEKDLLLKGKFDELLKYQNELDVQKEEYLKQKEENARLEDEAFVQAKMEASRRSKEKQGFDKSRLPNMKAFNSAQFAKWLSEENIDVTSPDFNVEDFDSFLEKVSLHGHKARGDPWEQTINHDATKDDASNSLQPVELHVVPKKRLWTKETVDVHKVVNQTQNAENFDAFIHKNLNPVEIKNIKECAEASSLGGEEYNFVTSSSEGFEELVTYKISI